MPGFHLAADLRRLAQTICLGGQSVSGFLDNEICEFIGAPFSIL